ncbi:hypothetical protein [Baekduia soli]|uniref:hypothetical protein n=1 Tax=Baekduia soli TaxID=496014 RepID=UPI002AA2ADA8|nr:hypothetical protein [Baekduia soli]
MDPITSPITPSPIVAVLDEQVGRHRGRGPRPLRALQVVVDEAWGGHLHFHPGLRRSAMDAGADLCVQSTHKLAGGLQRTGLTSR